MSKPINIKKPPKNQQKSYVSCSKFLWNFSKNENTCKNDLLTTTETMAFSYKCHSSACGKYHVVIGLDKYDFVSDSKPLLEIGGIWDSDLEGWKFEQSNRLFAEWYRSFTETWAPMYVHLGRLRCILFELESILEINDYCVINLIAEVEAAEEIYKKSVGIN